MRDNYPFIEAGEIAGFLIRSVKSIHMRAKTLNIKKHFSFKHQQGVTFYTHGKHSQFKKGVTPWNKGISYNAGGGSVETRFKKGRYVSFKDGYIQYSKGRPYRWVYAGTGKRELLHRKIWREAHGVIPKGTNIQFKDGNTLNCDITNLYPIERKHQVKKNSIHRFPLELQKTIRVLHKLKRKIKAYEE